MSTNEVRCLKRYFELKSVHISDYWLQCCLDWFKGEYNTYTEDYMCSSVYQQWLDSDLRDIEVRALPDNLTKQKKTILNGKYAVQVMYVKDISKPAYSQLKNIRDMYKLTRSHTENENEPVNTSGKRVLYLHMTDGVQNICGFEYHTVTCLNLYMTPGIKILLNGPLIVRNGEFMFKENNIKILGGEVEDLKVTNAAENVLARELNMPENPNPRSSEINSINTTVSSTQISTYTPNTSNINNQTNRNLITNRTVNSNNTRNNENNNINNVISEFEDDQFFANFDTSNFEEQEAVFQVENNYEDIDLDMDDNLFENLDFSEAQNKETTNFINDATLANIDNLEIERQEFERRLQEEEEDFDFHLDDIDIVSKVIEEKIKQKQTSLPTIHDPKPFIYIKYLLDNYNKLSNNKTYRIKAKFSNNIEKIKLSKNKGWTMKFEIKDPSGKLVVDFLSDVIENLMGLSPAEALAENRSVKNKESKSHEKLTEALAKCKAKMDSLEYIMDLKFNEERTVATIVNLEPVRKESLEQLKRRVESVSIKFL